MALTARRKERIVAAMRAGATVALAAKSAGIGKSTLYKHLSAGQQLHAQALASGVIDDDLGDGDPAAAIADQLAAAGWPAEDILTVQLSVEVDFALAYAEVRAVALWSKAMDTDWRAARDFLGRRFPERWGTGPRRVAGTAPDPVRSGDMLTKEEERELLHDKEWRDLMSDLLAAQIRVREHIRWVRDGTPRLSGPRPATP
jgi:hypothetical protein